MKQYLAILFAATTLSAHSGEAPDNLPIATVGKGATITLLRATAMPQLGEGGILVAGSSAFNSSSQNSVTDLKRMFGIDKDSTAIFSRKIVKMGLEPNAQDVAVTCALIGSKIEEGKPTPVLPKDRLLEVGDITVKDEARTSFSRPTDRILKIEIKDPKGFVQSLQCMNVISGGSFAAASQILEVGHIKALFPNLFSIDVLDQEVMVPEDKGNDLDRSKPVEHLI